MATHKFLLLKNESIDNIDKLIIDYYNGDRNNIEKEVEVEDDIILYMLDTFKFIKSSNVSGKLIQGIDYYGYSIFEGKEALKAKNIFESWRNIFKEGEEEFELTGEFTWIEDKVFDGEYRKMFFNKALVLEVLRDLVNIYDIGSKGECKVLHLGI